mmetsp:Transcript_20177/g.52519  ORF Transcript_20177/g.52519 Transcript_20177/m.52519 type:complete len:140 (-) Transcript_20177:1313-1732(-)
MQVQTGQGVPAAPPLLSTGEGKHAKTRSSVCTCRGGSSAQALALSGLEYPVLRFAGCKEKTAVRCKTAGCSNTTLTVPNKGHDVTPMSCSQLNLQQSALPHLPKNQGHPGFLPPGTQLSLFSPFATEAALRSHTENRRT